MVKSFQVQQQNQVNCSSSSRTFFLVHKIDSKTQPGLVQVCLRLKAMAVYLALVLLLQVAIKWLLRTEVLLYACNMIPIWRAIRSPNIYHCTYSKFSWLYCCNCSHAYLNWNTVALSVWFAYTRCGVHFVDWQQSWFFFPADLSQFDEDGVSTWKPRSFFGHTFVLPSFMRRMTKLSLVNVSRRLLAMSHIVRYNSIIGLYSNTNTEQTSTCNYSNGIVVWISLCRNFQAWSGVWTNICRSLKWYGYVFAESRGWSGMNKSLQNAWRRPEFWWPN